MSLVTLKKKTAAKYNSMSANRSAFSLNGTRRSQGYVGQDTLGRSLPRTPMSGNVPRGHGGCCGTYTKGTIVQSGVTCTNDPSILKASVVGTSGQLSVQNKWVRRPQPFAVVKPDSNQNINTQQDYIARMQQKAILEAKNSETACTSTAPNSCDALMQVFFARQGKSNVFKRSKDVCNVTKDLSGESKSQGLYMLNLTKQCYENDIYKFTRNTRSDPLPGN